MAAAYSQHYHSPELQRIKSHFNVVRREIGEVLQPGVAEPLLCCLHKVGGHIMARPALIISPRELSACHVV